MFDFLKNLTKSDEEKQQEAISAYLDDSLSPSQRRDFETLLAEDADLRAEIELAQLLRQQMREMPRRAVPRLFTLDATAYGAPRKEPLVKAYPFLRAATVMTAFFFVLALGLSVFTTQGTGNMTSVAQSAMEPAPALDAPMAEAEIAMGEVAEEIITEEEALAEEPAEEAAFEMPAESMPLPTLDAAMTKSTEMEEGGADDFADMVESAPVEEAEGMPPANAPAGAVGGEAATSVLTLTPLPTATISSLPRPDATETAVSRAIEPTILPPDEIANAVEDGETAVERVTSDQDQSPQAQSLTTTQVLLIGLGILLLLLLVVTLLTRRKI